MTSHNIDPHFIAKIVILVMQCGSISAKKLKQTIIAYSSCYGLTLFVTKTELGKPSIVRDIPGLAVF